MNPTQRWWQSRPLAEVSIVAKLAPGEDLLQAELRGGAHDGLGQWGLEPGRVDHHGPGRVLPLTVLVRTELLDQEPDNRHDGVLAALNVAEGAQEAFGEDASLPKESRSKRMLGRSRKFLYRSRSELCRILNVLHRS